MRTVFFNFGGTATPGDLVMLSYSGPRGGRSTVKYVVKGGGESDELIYDEHGVAGVNHTSVPPDSMVEVVSGLASGINSTTTEWSPGYGDFRAVPKGEKLIVMCSDLLSDVKFSFDVEGAQTETCEVEVIG